jgi:hypothetical protein
VVQHQRGSRFQETVTIAVGSIRSVYQWTVRQRVREAIAEGGRWG